MEVLLESADGHSGLKNTFVSMRIGDVQKQSRFSEPRKYVFPDPGEARQSFGRIEVFKRVGFTTVNFDNFQGKPQTVEVPCDGPDQLRLKVAVNSSIAPAAAQQEKVGKAKARLDAATKYLQEHRLEEILADAMRDVIHDRPDDPLTFLSSRLLANAKAPAKPKAEEAASKPAEKAKAAEAAKPGFPAEGFAAYYKQHVVTALPSVALGSLYAKFPAAVAAKAKAAAAPAPKGATPAFAKLASVGTWLAPKPRPIQKIAAAGAGSSTARPPVALKRSFAQMPSVGSWLAPAPATAAPKAAKAPEKTYRAWTLKPSVGTWLCDKPEHAEDLGASCLAFYASSEDLMHSMSGEDMIKVFRHELAKKDEELEALRRRVAGH